MILRFLPDNAMLLSGFSILFFLLLAPMGAAAFGLSDADSVYPLCLSTLAVVVWIFLTLKHISRDVFNFYSLFVTSAILFNAGQTLLEVFHLNAAGLLGDKFTSATLTSTLYLVALCLVCFHTGGILGAAGGDRVAQEDDRPFLSAHALRMTGYLLLSISAIPALFTINHALEIVLRGGYFALYQKKQLAGLASGVEGAIKFVSGFFVPGLLFALAGHKNHKVPRIVLQFVIFVQVCTLMFLGYRGYSSMLLMAVLWMRHRLIRPLRLRWTLIAGIVLILVVFPTVSAIRDIKGTSRLAGKVFVDAFLSIENPAVAILTVMGESMETVAYTLQLIPKERPFAWGSTYALGATEIIPNLFWDVHPSTMYANLGHWLTKSVDPDRYFAGGGMAFSFIAEAYANVSFWLAPLIIGLIGFIIARLVRWAAAEGNDGGVVVVAGCTAYMLQWARGDVTIFIRPVFLYVLIPYCVYLVLRKNPIV